MRFKLPKSVSVLAAVVAGTGSALAAPALAGAIAGPELKLGAVDDTYTSSSRRNATFGTEDKLVTGRLGKDVKVSFLKFTVPAGTDVTGAELTLTTVGDVAGKLAVHRVVDNGWTEKKLASGTAPALGLAVASAAPKANDTQVTFDLGAEVTGPGTYSFAVQSTAAQAVRFRSAENKSGAPVLTVATAAEAAPVTEPTTPPVEPTTPADDYLPGDVPATTEPTTEPTKPPAGECATDAKLVPSCGVLWGGAAGGFTDAPRDQALKDWEKLSGRTATIFHTYHKGDEPFPTKAEIAMTRDAAKPRVLLLNWKIACGSTWAPR